MNIVFLKRPPAPPGEQHLILSLKEFLVIEETPTEWLGLNLYIFREDHIAFYIGQSERAYERAWQHIIDGYKGRSVIGRFILCNWPASMHFTLEFYRSSHTHFTEVMHDLNAAEKQLIHQWQPCFNVIANPTPSPLPDCYQSPDTKPRHLRRLGRMKSEAHAHVRGEKRRRTLDEIAEQEKEIPNYDHPLKEK